MKNMFKKSAKGLSGAKTSDSSPGNFESRRYDSWSFRLVHANGGCVVEASFSPSYNSNEEPVNELYIISNDEEISEELPKIITECYLKH